MIDYSRIPDGLRSIPQWILWRAVPKEGGLPAKVPTDADLHNCDPHNPKNWMSFDAAIQLQQSIYAKSGIQLWLGFVLTEADQIVCVDLDGCHNPFTGEVAPWALNFVRVLRSYTEVSPSGTGLKVFVICTNSSYIRLSHRMAIERVSEKDPRIEIFSAKQFMAVTGVHFGSDTLNDRTTMIEAMVSECPSNKCLPGGSKSPSHNLDFQDNTDAETSTVDAARAFVLKMPVAVNGSRGHDATYAVACRLMIDFGLSSGQAIDIFEEWNSGCLPPWGKWDLERKLREAGKLTGERGFRAPNAIAAKMFGDLKATMDSCMTPTIASAAVPHSDNFVPFPVKHLPLPLRTFINAVAASIGCDPSFVALPVLAACAAAIGNTRTLVLKPGWTVPAMLWCVVVGESGTQKTPAFKAAQKPLAKRQAQLNEKFREEVAAFKAAKADLKKNRTPPDTSNLESEPAQPIIERCLVSDTTIEGLVLVLRDNWRGVLLARDEVSGWIGAFDKYSSKGKTSVDAAHWVSIYSGQAMIIDRKTGDDRTIIVPHPAVSVCGGIQPEILNKVIGGEHRENGLLARLLLCYPPRRQKRWTEESVTPSVEAEYDNVISALFDLQGEVVGQDFVSIPVGLSPGALDLIKEHVDNNGAEQFGLTGELAAAWSKLEEVAPRLALLIHCVRYVSGEIEDPLVCDADSMEAAVKLTTWFKNETRRVYQRITESTEERQRRELVEWIAKQGGRVCGRDVLAGRQAKNADDAEAKLQGLVKARYGQWEHSQNATGPTAQVFVLSSQISNGLSAGSA